MFQLLPGTVSNFHGYHFYFLTLPHALFLILVLFPLFVPFLQLALLLLLFSYVLRHSYFSHTSPLFLHFTFLLESWRKLFFGGDAGTPGNVKVIAGDCQRLLEIVDNSTFKNVTILTKSYKKLIFVRGLEKSAFFNDQGNFLGRLKYN